jgi:hypothetical protein
MQQQHTLLPLQLPLVRQLSLLSAALEALLQQTQRQMASLLILKAAARLVKWTASCWLSMLLQLAVQKQQQGP